MHSLLQTLDECFQEIKSCSSSRRTWLSTRKAFVASAIKTNQINGLGFNLNKCKLDPGEDPDDDKKEEKAMGLLLFPMLNSELILCFYLIWGLGEGSPSGKNPSLKPLHHFCLQITIWGIIRGSQPFQPHLTNNSPGTN